MKYEVKSDEGIIKFPTFDEDIVKREYVVYDDVDVYRFSMLKVQALVQGGQKTTLKRAILRLLTRERVRVCRTKMSQLFEDYSWDSKLLARHLWRELGKHLSLRITPQKNFKGMEYLLFQWDGEEL